MSVASARPRARSGCRKRSTRTRAQAKHVDGVLQLTLPKLAKTNSEADHDSVVRLESTGEGPPRSGDRRELRVATANSLARGTKRGPTSSRRRAFLGQTRARALRVAWMSAR